VRACRCWPGDLSRRGRGWDRTADPGQWYSRWLLEGEAGLQDRSSRPSSSPNQTDASIKARVVALRSEHNVEPVQLVGLAAQEGIVLLGVHDWVCQSDLAPLGAVVLA